MSKTEFKLMTHDEPPYDDEMIFARIKYKKFYLNWFTDCGEWFFYVGVKDWHGLRFSSAGFMRW